ncbi:MAG: hypothetical protein LBI16_03595 [Burkholderiales bacterium]|jgi:hypothetical protein|nr:hypothetical protein [Burkholderiales bacterium]
MKTSKEIRFDSLLLVLARNGRMSACTKNAITSPSHLSQFKNIVMERKASGAVEMGDDVAGKIETALGLPVGEMAAGCSDSAFPTERPFAVDKKNQWNVPGGTPLSFQTNGLRRLKAKPKNLLAVKVASYSMALCLLNGNTVALNRSGAQTPMGGSKMPERCLFTLPGGFRMQSDNPSEGPMFEPVGDRTDAAQPVGRVRCTRIGDFYLTKESL